MILNEPNFPIGEKISAVEVECPPFVYAIPSPWQFVRTEPDDLALIDIYDHPGVGEFQVERILMTRAGGASTPMDALEIIKSRSEEVDELHTKPVSLRSGMATISYTNRDEDDATRHWWYVELCGFYAPLKLVMLRYATCWDKDGRPPALAELWMHLVLQIARESRLIWED